MSVNGKTEILALARYIFIACIMALSIPIIAQAESWEQCKNKTKAKLEQECIQKGYTYNCFGTGAPIRHHTIEACGSKPSPKELTMEIRNILAEDCQLDKDLSSFVRYRLLGYYTDESPIVRKAQAECNRIYEKNRPSWWVDFAHEPTKTKYEDIKASKYNPNFSNIEIFDCETHEIFTKPQCDEVSEKGGKFKLIGDFNRDGKEEILKVGVAKYRKGKYPYANVVLIKDRKSNSINQVLTVETKSPGFASFFQKNGSIWLAFCMDCGIIAILNWGQNSWQLKWPNY